MHTIYASPPILFVRPFHLIPNQAGTGSERIVVLYGVVVVPLLLVGIFLYHLMALRNTHLLIAMVLVLLVLLNIYFFFMRHQNASNAWSLQIDLGEIQLLQNGQVLHRELLKNIHTTQLNWGRDTADPLSVIRIEGEHFPKLYIASAPARNARPNLRKIQEAADYRVASKGEWQRLLQVLTMV